MLLIKIHVYSLNTGYMQENMFEQELLGRALYLHESAKYDSSW